MFDTPPGMRDWQVSVPDEYDDWWKEKSFSLDYEGHDIWVFFDRSHIHREGDSVTFSPPLFGDLDPNPDGPDLDVWPLPHDPGAPGPQSNESVERYELTRILNPYPVPHVAYVTDRYLEKSYGYNPTAVELQAKEVPPYARPDDAFYEDTFTATPGSSGLSLTAERREAISREVALWNGQLVRGNHIIYDKMPSYKAVFGDLDYEELRQLHVTQADPELVDAFHHCKWFQRSSDLYFTDTYVLGKKAYYNPTAALKTLANNRDGFDSFRGDQFERLRHRVTVGLLAVKYAQEYQSYDTYVDVGAYNVDFGATSTARQPLIVEVMTGHNNWSEYRDTYRKLADLSQDAEIHVAVDSRDTAQTVINHWLNSGLAYLPSGTFNAEPNLDNLKNQVESAAHNPDYNWVIEDVHTTTTLWNETLGSQNPPSRKFVVSLEW